MKILNRIAKHIIQSNEIINLYIKNPWEDCKKIYNTLSKEEMTLTGTFDKENKHIVYRNILYTNNTYIPVGFIELYNTKAEEKELYNLTSDINDVNCLIIVHSEYRQQHIGYYLLNLAIEWFYHSSYKSFSFICHSNNIASKALAKSCNFAYVWGNKKENLDGYILTNKYYRNNYLNNKFLSYTSVLDYQDIK